jgi:kynurenine formamidase
VITLQQIRDLDLDENIESVVIRTLPNNEYKKSCTYTGTNPPYLDSRIAQFLIDRGVEHLLVDLPSVDKEQDDGVLAFHHAFWNVPENPNTTRTITEFIFVPSNVEDGLYILNLQMSAFCNDASPSRPILYSREQRNL